MIGYVTFGMHHLKKSILAVLLWVATGGFAYGSDRPAEAWMAWQSGRAVAQASQTINGNSGHAVVFEIAPNAGAVEDLVASIQIADLRAGFSVNDYNLVDSQPLITVGYILVQRRNLLLAGGARYRHFYTPGVETGRVCRISVVLMTSDDGLREELQNWCERNIPPPPAPPLPAPAPRSF
jgi:hypothetical protein